MGTEKNPQHQGAHHSFAIAPTNVGCRLNEQLVLFG